MSWKTDYNHEIREHNHAVTLAMIKRLEETRGSHVALAEAARWSVPQEIERLLGSGVDPDARLDRNMTPLMYSGTRRSAEILLKAGADPNATDDDGSTPLIWFFRGKHQKRQAISRVKLYLKHGADPLIADDLGKTALDYASPRFDSDVLSLLR